ncbi:mucin-2 [Sardina pilchardus]|uniref:mucin-2 n=1 Tax=Sardina pilchardus TaxID=27697 RepID=UPI002E13E5C5
MAQLGSVSDSEGLVQSMLQRLRLQEQRSEQASATSEDTDKILQELEDDEETLTSTVNDNPRSSRTKWPFFKGSTKALGLRKGSTKQKDNLSCSIFEEEVPRWERKQLRLTLVSNQTSARENGHVDKADAHLEPPLNHENHTSPAGEAEAGPRPPVMQTQTNAEVQHTDSTKGNELSTPLTPGSAIQEHTVTDSPIWDRITTEDTASSSTDSLSRNNQPVGEVVSSKTSNNVRKNKRKWAERKSKLTKKIKDKWRDRHPSVERRGSQNGEEFGEKQHQHNVAEQVSNESSEVKENAVRPLPTRGAEDEVTPCPQGYDSISLCAFDLGFSTTLMEDIFTGSEWDKFLTTSNSPLEVLEESTNDQSTYPAAVDQYEIAESHNAVSLPESTLHEATEEAMLTDTDELPNAGQPMCIESSEHSINQLTVSEQVSHIQPGTAEVNSDQGITTEPQMTTNSLDQSNSDAVNHDQSETESESSICDIKDQQTHMMEADLNQTSPSDTNPHQTENTTPNLDQTTTREINPRQTQMTTPDLIETSTSSTNSNVILTTQADDQSDQETDESHKTEPTLNQPDSSDMMNPYLTETTQTGDQSETEEASEPTINSSPCEDDDNSPQFIPPLDFFYLETGDGKDSSAHEKKRRALQSEERETFIDEDDDDDDGDVPTKSVSHQNVPLLPPPFAPPPPPPHLVTQCSISLDSDSSLSMEVMPKKRKLDCTPRRVRFAAEVVMLPSYIQPEVEDWPEPEGMEEDSDDTDDPEDMEDSDEAVQPEEIRTAKEASGKSPEAQQSLYNWIVGIKRKNKRKAQI